jgi:hypothetical protein
MIHATDCDWQTKRKACTCGLPGAPKVAPLPDDVVRLVVAARNVAFEDHPSREALKELDAASEAFASRVPWEDEPYDEELASPAKPQEGE